LEISGDQRRFLEINRGEGGTQIAGIAKIAGNRRNRERPEKILPQINVEKPGSSKESKVGKAKLVVV
jgi:hypothetical protein